MKLHVDFDAVLNGILEQDPQGFIVLLYSPSQLLWKNLVVERFKRTVMSRRVIFLETMPYERFMQLLAAADVMLDPFPFGGGVTNS